MLVSQSGYEDTTEALGAVLNIEEVPRNSG
jgi:hypothetical protein